MTRAGLALILLFLAAPARADFSGPVEVVDGDTLHVSGTTVRLFGIDAPEMDQTCRDAGGREWGCGAFVAAELARRYGGQTATCEPLDTDRYGRTVARCRVAGRDIAEDLVLDGWATAYQQYSQDYVLAEKSAQLRQAGLWSGTMQSPAAFRAESVPPEQLPPDPNCVIKGNISDSGRIYHMPGNRDYGRTRIDLSAGERWFCSQSEARAAGWRPAGN